MHLDYGEYTCIKITYTFVCLHTDIILKIWYLELKENVITCVGNVHVYYMYSYLWFKVNFSGLYFGLKCVYRQIIWYEDNVHVIGWYKFLLFVCLLDWFVDII